MSHLKDGGPAFATPLFVAPVEDGYAESPHQSGMTLWQYYAGQALQGMLSNSLPVGNKQETAEAALEYADAMIAAIEQRNGPRQRTPPEGGGPKGSGPKGGAQ